VNPVHLLLAALVGVRKVGDGWTACCPAHEDRRPSLSINEGEDGRALVKCHAGCSFEAIVEAAGLTVRDLKPDRDGPAPNRNGKPKPDSPTYPSTTAVLAALERRHGKRSEHWTYHDTAGNAVGLVVRWDGREGKTIRPAARHSDGWRIGAMPDPRPLYGLRGLATAARVVVVEGEPAAEAARSIGFSATTSANGSGSADKTDWSPLAGKEVWLLPDNDVPGRKYAETVVALLAALSPAPVVRVIELPGLPDKGDIADWIDAHGAAADPDAMRAEVEALATATEPEADPPPGHDTDRFRPFPVDALPEPVRGFVAAGAKAIGCDPSYLALPLLAALAAAIGNTRRLELKRSWSVPPILWAAIVGESGTTKTPAFRLVMRPVRERERTALERHATELERHAADLSRWEKASAAWKRKANTPDDPPPKPKPPRAERYVVADTTVEALAPLLLSNPRGLLLARDELSGWIGSFDRYAGKGVASADAANWLSMYNGESYIVDRKTAGQQPLHVPDAAVCITGGIQPGVFRRAFGTEYRESGMVARFLLAFPPQKTKTWTEADIDPQTELAIAALLDRLYDLQPEKADTGDPRPVVVRLAPPAKEAWVTYYNAHAAEQAELEGDLSAAWSKLEEAAARLALVVHLARWAGGDAGITDPTILDAASMTAGITLATWFKGEARRVYALFSETETERTDRRLVEWVERWGGTATVRKVQQWCRWLKKSGAAEAALDRLVKAGRGRWVPPATTPKGGRPPRAFTLFPLSTVYETPATDLDIGGFVDVDTVDDPATPIARNPDDPLPTPDELPD
jgi:hypothetical protein